MKPIKPAMPWPDSLRELRALGRPAARLILPVQGRNVYMTAGTTGTLVTGSHKDDMRFTCDVCRCCGMTASLKVNREQVELLG